MLASLMGHVQVLPILLDAGADPLIRDSHGLTALEWAQRRGFHQIIELLSGTPSSSEPIANTTSQDDSTTPARLRPQELGPATMAVLKTVHASLEAQRQRAGTATQMAPATTDPANGEVVPAVDAQQPPEQDGHGERDRLFSAGVRKLEAQHRAHLVHEEQTFSASSDTAPLVDPLATNAFITAPLVAPSSAIESEAPPSVVAQVESDSTSWSAPELEPATPIVEPKTETNDEATVVAAEPVVPAAQPPAPKSSFLHNSFLDAKPTAPSAGPSVLRPIVWVIVIFGLIGSVYLTYVVTSRFMNRNTTGANNVASNSTTTASVATTAAKSSQFPQTAGAIANAESELPDAEYPSQAKNDRVTGMVTVVVRVNRVGGSVTTAHALNGDKVLRAAAEKAAKQAKFSPDKLRDESKVVSGTITYRFGDAPIPNNPVTDPNEPVLGGALVGTGLSLPKAEYPGGPTSRNASGSVLVVARVNRFGDVIAAHALNGDSQLRASAEKAAQKAKFSKDKLPRESLVTSGTITYNFKASSQPIAANNSAPNPNPTPVAATPPVKPANDLPVVGGDLAGKEKNIPKAEYPDEARRKAISGTVTILIRVNKHGQVISWRTLSGDQALRAAALKAARKATFSPEKLGNIDSILGTVTYNFHP
jgi:TonB family protein